jgi:hypothetical protein
MDAAFLQPGIGRALGEQLLVKIQAHFFQRLRQLVARLESVGDQIFAAGRALGQFIVAADRECALLTVRAAADFSGLGAEAEVSGKDRGS